VGRGRDHDPANRSMPSHFQSRLGGLGGLPRRPSPFRQLRCRGHLVSFYIDGFGRLGNHHTLMKSPPIDFIARLQIGRQQAVPPLQALDHRAHVVVSLHDGRGGGAGPGDSLNPAVRTKLLDVEQFPPPAFES